MVIFYCKMFNHMIRLVAFKSELRCIIPMMEVSMNYLKHSSSTGSLFLGVIL